MSEARRVRTRRELLSILSLALGGLAATIIAIPVIGAILAPLVRPQSPVWRTVGSLSDFQIGSTTEVTFVDPSPLAWAGVGAQTAAWLRRVDAESFEAFAINCTHLGCPVRWIDTAQLFMCPCHGGVFNADGSVAAGPPEKPLSLYPVRVSGADVQIQAGAVPNV